MRPTMTNVGSWRAASAAFILPTPSSIEIRRGLPLAPYGVGSSVSSMHIAADAGGLQFLDRAHHVERVAVAVIGIDQQRQLAGAIDAIGLVGELGEGQHDQVGRAEHRERADRAGEHADLEAEILGDARGDRIEHRARMDAAIAREDRAEALRADRSSACNPPALTKPERVARVPARVSTLAPTGRRGVLRAIDRTSVRRRERRRRG